MEVSAYERILNYENKYKYMLFIWNDYFRC